MSRGQNFITSIVLAAVTLLGASVSFALEVQPAALSRALVPQCFHDYVIGVFEGHPVDSKLPFSVPDGATVFELGTGIAGGTTYRVVSPDGTTVVRKVYFDKYGASMDTVRLNVIQNVMAEHPSAAGDNFRVVKSRKISTGILEMEDVRGTPLDKIFKDPTVPDPVKWALADKYQNCLQNLIESMEKRYGKVVSRKDGYIKIGSGGPLTEFFVKQNNIVVTPSGELVVIDPY